MSCPLAFGQNRVLPDSTKKQAEYRLYDWTQKSTPSPGYWPTGYKSSATNAPTSSAKKLARKKWIAVQTFSFNEGKVDRYESTEGSPIVITLNESAKNKTTFENDLDETHIQLIHRDNQTRVAVFTMFKNRPDLSTVKVFLDDNDHVYKIMLKSYTYVEKAKMFFSQHDCNFSKQMLEIFTNVSKSNQLKDQAQF